MKPSSTVVKCIELLQEIRERTLALITDPDDEQLTGPRLSIVNPLRWEIGHVGTVCIACTLIFLERSCKL